MSSTRRAGGWARFRATVAAALTSLVGADLARVIFEASDVQRATLKVGYAPTGHPLRCTMPGPGTMHLIECVFRGHVGVVPQVWFEFLWSEDGAGHTLCAVMRRVCRGRCGTCESVDASGTSDACAWRESAPVTSIFSKLPLRTRNGAHETARRRLSLLAQRARGEGKE